MAYYLLKTEPDDYSAADLQRDKSTIWDGVGNNAALKNMRGMVKGDLCLIYHTADERQCVSIAEVTKPAYPDPSGEDEKRIVVNVKHRKMLEKPVTLAEIKKDPAFEGFDLIRIGRLSVVPVPPAMWNRLLKLADTTL